MEKNNYYIELLNSIIAIAKQFIVERISLIDYNKDLYKFMVEESKDGEPMLVIFYNSQVYLTIKPLCRYMAVDGERRVRGCFWVKFRNDSDWYKMDEYKSRLVYVDEKMNWEIQNKNYSTDEFMNTFLPVGKKQECRIIQDDLKNLGISIDKVPFDTMNQRYILDIDLLKYLNVKVDTKEEKLYLCKYMSLDTFMCIAETQKIRLNSIVSMNDTSESFFLGDYLCNAYDDIRRKNTDVEYYNQFPEALRYCKVIERKKNLIMCLTSRIDDAMMWRLYGDNGRGICMCFSVPYNIVRPITYLSEKNEKLKELKTIASKWAGQGINVMFTDIDKYMFFIKSIQFEYEHEYRLMKECEEKDLETTKYGDLISFYKDYVFSDSEIKPETLYIGSNLPQRDVNYPLIVDIANRMLNIHIINNSSMDQLRV